MKSQYRRTPQQAIQECKAIVQYDIQAPLNLMTGYAHLLKELLDDDEQLPAKGDLEDISFAFLSAADNSRKLYDTLLQILESVGED